MEVFKSENRNNLVHDTPILDVPNAAPEIQQNFAPTFDTSLMTPLDDPKYLLQNAYCFKTVREFSNTSVKQNPKKNEELHLTTQYLFGCYMPPYFSVLNSKLMGKLVSFLNYPYSSSKLLTSYKEVIEHEQVMFLRWLSPLWEEDLKNRRLNVIPYIEDYIKSACNVSNKYVKSCYGGSYRSKMTIDYNKDVDEVTNKVKMTYCSRVKASDVKYSVNFPTIDIKNVSSKISFTDGIYTPSEKLPFAQDELCQTLSKEHGSNVNICLSSLKRIMNLQKPNSLWLVPVNIDIDADNCKTINIGGALSTGHFSQQEKSLYYLKKELKKKFRKPVTMPIKNESIENSSKYNYDKWTLKVDGINDDADILFNILVRNKPHTQAKMKPNMDGPVLIPKVEYQPEFGFEKDSEDQIVEYWLNTYFRTPKMRFALVSVQHNMDIMMIKQKFFEDSLLSDDQKQTYLHRLYLTLHKLSQLDKGKYVMLHNPKKPFQVELYQSSTYGGFNLLNMYLVLQQTAASDTLTWNPIDPKVICPIHNYFKVAPCMFKPNPVLLNVQMICDQVNKFKTVMETNEKNEKERVAIKNKRKKEKNREKKKLQRENDAVFNNIKCKTLNQNE